MARWRIFRTHCVIESISGLNR